MRVGLIADVHSNAEALRAVLREFDDRGVEKIICLGDVIGIGARPEESVQLLAKNQDRLLSCVRGNHEDYLLKALPIYNHNDPTKNRLPKEIIDLFKWNHQRLSSKSIDFLRQFMRQEVINIEGITIFVTHYPINPETDVYMPHYFKPTPRQCEEIFSHQQADIYLYGHTHTRNIVASKKGCFYINPGSVGCPIGTDSASAGILDIHNGDIHYDQLDVDYNIDEAIEEMLSYHDEIPLVDYTVEQYYRNGYFDVDAYVAKHPLQYD